MTTTVPFATTSAWERLKESLTGALLLPGTSAYESARHPARPQPSDSRPAGIVMAADVADVAAAVAFGREHGVPTVPRSGGHCYAGRSSTSGLLIDLARMDQITVTDGYVTVGARPGLCHRVSVNRLHEWLFTTRWWQPGGSGGVDDAFAQQHGPGIGAEIMGAGKFGHPGWHEDPQWKGAWGLNPPFHTPVFVLTHHPRPSIEMEGGTAFHFIDASPAEALETARGAAGGQDVRIGGGPTMIRDFLAAGLIDHMHIVVVPILLGRGVRLWDGLEGLEKDFQVEATSSPSGVTHVTFTRTGL